MCAADLTHSRERKTFLCACERVLVCVESIRFSRSQVKSHCHSRTTRAWVGACVGAFLCVERIRFYRSLVQSHHLDWVSPAQSPHEGATCTRVSARRIGRLERMLHVLPRYDLLSSVSHSGGCIVSLLSSQFLSPFTLTHSNHLNPSPPSLSR